MGEEWYVPLVKITERKKEEKEKEEKEKEVNAAN